MRNLSNLGLGVLATLAITANAAARRAFSTAPMRTLVAQPASVVGSNPLAYPATSHGSYLMERGDMPIHGRRRGYSDGGDSAEAVQLCSRSIGGTLVRGALLRIASDLSGGTVFETIKTRVTVSTEDMASAMRNIVQSGGIGALWKGTPSRTVEGALIGSVFMLASTITKTRLRSLGAGPTAAALSAGLVGGLAQAVIMTPAGMVFTSLNANIDGAENETAFSITKRIIQEKGVLGMYAGIKPMAIRQASNWASRAGFTEIARNVLGLQRYGILGEIGSGVLGGIGSCWNTPVETIRVVTQRDLSIGVPVKTMRGYWDEIVERDGIPGLFRGVTPRGLQAIWQTCFLVVVPNMMGL